MLMAEINLIVVHTQLKNEAGRDFLVSIFHCRPTVKEGALRWDVYNKGTAHITSSPSAVGKGRE